MTVLGRGLEIGLEMRLTSDGRAEVAVAWKHNGLPEHRLLPLQRFLRVVRLKGGRYGSQPSLCSSPVTLTYGSSSRVAAVCAQHTFYYSGGGYRYTRMSLLTGAQTQAGIIWAGGTELRRQLIIPDSLTQEWQQIGSYYAVPGTSL